MFIFSILYHKINIFWNIIKLTNNNKNINKDIIKKSFDRNKEKIYDIVTFSQKQLTFYLHIFEKIFGWIRLRFNFP